MWLYPHCDTSDLKRNISLSIWSHIMADLKGLNQGEQGRSNAANSTADKVNAVPAAADIDALGLKNPAFWYSGGFITIFVLMAIFAEAQLATIVDVGFKWSANIFGPFLSLIHI